jgi:hypothetical protein
MLRLSRNSYTKCTSVYSGSYSEAIRSCVLTYDNYDYRKPANRMGRLRTESYRRLPCTG